MKNDNELIAEFMEFIDGGNYYASSGKNPFLDEDGSHRILKSQLKFDTSYDWIMAVIEKIRKDTDGCILPGVVFTIKNSKATIKEGKKTFSCHTINPLNSVYRVVVEYIKWYTKTNTTS